MTTAPITAEGRDRIARVELSTYSMEAVLKSAYRFSGRYFVHVQPGDGRTAEVRIRPKLESDDPDTVVGEFCNDLLDQRLREIVAAETAGVRDLVMAHALSKTTLIRPDLESADPKVDPQHVSIPDRKRAASV